MMKVFKNQEVDIKKFDFTKQGCDFPQINTSQNKFFSKNEEISNENVISQNLESQIIAILNSEFCLIKRIGKGSTGSVYLSFSIKDQKESKTFYAIKILEQKQTNNNYINYCEVNFLQKMNHKNILKVYEHGLGFLETTSGLKYQAHYIIMDYLNHGSLLSQVEGNMGFGEDYGRLIFAQLLEGIEAIHNSNIVHRDIKLDNIMLSGNDYTLKYVDFGFATEESNGYLTTFLGTPNYAAPEIHLKQPYLGVYEDIFSLGVTLFIIVTGHLPFLLPIPNDPLYQYIVWADYINYWRKRNIKVSHSFMELFDNLIAFDPSQRPSISEIKKSKWMQEINWSLLSSLKKEYIKREDIKKNTCLSKQNKKKALNKEIINKNKEGNADEILLKIKEKKKIEVINDIKRQLFSLNNQIGNKKGENNIIEAERIIEEEKPINNHNCNNECALQGFIKINVNYKNLNPMIIILRQFFKNEGYNITKKDLDNLNIEISNGEVDVKLFFEKMFKEIKISFNIINGNKEDFLNFKKIMKKFNIKNNS